MHETPNFGKSNFGRILRQKLLAIDCEVAETANEKIPHAKAQTAKDLDEP